MEACRNYSEVLMQDALGELSDPQVRHGWQAHLLSCDACRREKARLQTLFAKIRDVGGAPTLSATQADAIARKVGWRLRNQRHAVSAANKRRPFRLAWALASGCMLIIAVAAGYRLYDRLPAAGRIANLPQELQVPKEDLDVIKNLDLLKELDTIDKLVNVVDAPNGEAPAAEPQQGRQGTTSYDYGTEVA
jgi:hypothetical protein